MGIGTFLHCDDPCREHARMRSLIDSMHIFKGPGMVLCVDGDDVKLKDYRYETNKYICSDSRRVEQGVLCGGDLLTDMFVGRWCHCLWQVSYKEVCASRIIK
jgi:hypothetical protein